MIATKFLVFLAICAVNFEFVISDDWETTRVSCLSIKEKDAVVFDEVVYEVEKVSKIRNKVNLVAYDECRKKRIQRVCTSNEKIKKANISFHAKEIKVSQFAGEEKVLVAAKTPTGPGYFRTLADCLDKEMCDRMMTQLENLKDGEKLTADTWHTSFGICVVNFQIERE